MVCARNALGLNTEIVGVVSSAADCYAKSLEAGACVSTESADTLADGMAVRVPSPEALAIMRGNVARIVTVDDNEVLAAMAIYFSDTHNIAEGAGAAPLAALLQERTLNAGKKVGLILSGGNVDKALYCKALSV
jgi:threonine dehydratase